MTTEDYVSFETAKLLKEKGFDENCAALYHLRTGEIIQQGVGYVFNNSQWENFVSAPTLQMAMKWLRKVHHYYIQVMLDSWAYGSHSGYYVVIQKTDSEFEIMLADKVDKVFYDEPEEACETAIKYCLENLIRYDRETIKST